MVAVLRSRRDGRASVGDVWEDDCGMGDAVVRPMCGLALASEPRSMYARVTRKGKKEGKSRE